MKLYLLAFLACPECGKDVRYDRLKDYPREDEEIETGSLHCVSCKHEYPIVDGVPRMFPGGEHSERVKRTRQSFGWEWERYPGDSRELDRDVFLEETQIPLDGWTDSVVLDGGCGMGRYAKVALALGADVIAFDLSDAVLRLIPTARRNRHLHLVQGDLLKPPFKPGVFDIVYSQGVIHHTADTRKAFDSLSTLVKVSGLLSVWVYGTPGSWGSFSTNPLRSGRKWLRFVLPLVWIIVWIRQILSDLLRVVTTRLPVPFLYALCFPLAFLGYFPLIKYLTFSVERGFMVRVIENFDWLAPPYQTKHTKEEVAKWYEEANCDIVSHLPHGMVPKVGILARKGHKA